MASSPRQTTTPKFTPAPRKRTIITLPAPKPGFSPSRSERIVLAKATRTTPSRSERIVLSPSTTPAPRKRTVIVFPPSTLRTAK